MAANWKGRKVLVTGGASFIGSHLSEALLALGARVTVVDNLCSGRRANLEFCRDNASFAFLEKDLLDPGAAREVIEGQQVVFHLAAIHGGRGFIDSFHADCSTNFMLDGLIIHSSQRLGVEKLVFASSGCVYPTALQQDPSQPLFLAEKDVGPPYDADNIYGWAKLMGEKTLRALNQQHGFRSACCRLFTVYGERSTESHAVIAMIARAHVGQAPFEVWGDGTQVRNWTYVSDIVRGLIRAGESIDDGTAVNLGTMEATTVSSAAQQILGLLGHDAEIRYMVDKPTGPLNRVADNSLAKSLCGWEPTVRFEDGLKRTVDWYVSTHSREQATAALVRNLS